MHNVVLSNVRRDNVKKHYTVGWVTKKGIRAEKLTSHRFFY